MTQIGLSPQTIQNVVIYDVVITASNPELLLEPGMTATNKIVVSSVSFGAEPVGDFAEHGEGSQGLGPLARHARL